VEPTWRDEPQVVCRINIGPNGRRRRLALGLAGALLTAAIAAWLIAIGSPRWWRALLIVPWSAAVAGLLQARGRT
jgi:hypothetical protein